MHKPSEDLLARLLTAFKMEAGEHYQAITSSLLKMEATAGAAEQAVLIESVFRETHSLKGAARAVGLTNIETLCQALESIFATWRAGTDQPAVEHFDLLHTALNELQSLLVNPQTVSAQYSALLERLLTKKTDAPSGNDTVKDDGIHPPPFTRQSTIRDQSAVTRATQAPETEHTGDISATAQKTLLGTQAVRISAETLESYLRQVEELLGIKYTLRQRLKAVESAREMIDLWKQRRVKIHPDLPAFRCMADRNDDERANGRHTAGMRRLIEFLDWDQDQMKSLDQRLTVLAECLGQDAYGMGVRLDALHTGIKSSLLCSFSLLFEIVPKLVRDLSRTQGKQVELRITGEDVEVDRRILEALKEPLIHLIRNCIDHGIETPAVRADRHKPAGGLLRITVTRMPNNWIEIGVADDGAGIDVRQIRQAAIKRGLMAEKDATDLTDQALLPMVFESGVTTSTIITDISGQGLGLAIVREKIEKLGGSIAVESHAGMGTTFTMQAPAIVSAFRGILVRASGRSFVVPTMHVIKAVHITRDAIKTVENREIISFEEQPVSLVRLSDILELPGEKQEETAASVMPALILGTKDRQMAFLVDAVLDELEVMMQGMGAQLPRVRNILGAALLGAGEVVPIVNVLDMLKTAVQNPVTPSLAGEETDDRAGRQRSVLVVEDSITSRMLLKNILESSGYTVHTAIDGVDALTLLKTEIFDGIVSDVDMPRMNGFELTTRIRQDRKLAELPVVLVTSLDSREDRERGIDAGANAYLIKSSFDQSHLLQVLERLI